MELSKEDKEIIKKNLSIQQKEVCRKVEYQINEYEMMFEIPAEEVMLSEKDFNTLKEDEKEYKYLTFRGIKLFKIK